MPNIRKRMRAIIQRNKEEHEESLTKKDRAKRCVFSTLYTGVGYTAACILFLLNDIIPPSNNLFYQCQTEIVKVLLEMAKESAFEEAAKLQPGTTVSIDGSWTHRRNSRSFILDVIDPKTHKIVDFELVDKGSKFRRGNFNLSSNLMEAYAFNQSILRLMRNPNITGIIKDGDTKLEKIIANHHWNVSIYLDPNHLKKNWPKLFQQYNKLANNSMKGLKKKILAHINHVLYSDGTPEEKRSLFMNSFYHFMGNHTFCEEKHDTPKWKFADDPAKTRLLFGLLNKTANLFGDFDPAKTTNPNEFFHTLKGYVLPKIYHWESSWIGRISIAILNNNRGDDWLAEAFWRLHMKSYPVHTWVQLLRFLKARMKKAIKNREKKKSEEEQKKRREAKEKAIKESKVTSEYAHN